MIGQKLGHYEVTAKIGKGGMGVVYRATDTLIGRDVALKTIQLTEIEDPNERQFLKERLFREAKSAGILSHPNIVTVYQIGEQDGLTYIAMEFVDGANLGEILARPERQGMDVLLSVFDQSAHALDYAHSRGVVHRDIKPGNIIVRSDGVAKIADFGVAKISSQNVTRTGMTLGTPHYMSPEQFHGRTIDGRSDQYSLAVMVYEILTGKKPFTADSITGLMYKILHEEANPRRDNPDLSEEVDRVLRKALAKDPDKRYPSCSEFIRELRTVSGMLPEAYSVEGGHRTPGTGMGTVRPLTVTPLNAPTGMGRAGAPTPTPTPVPLTGSQNFGGRTPTPTPTPARGVPTQQTPSGGMAIPPPPPVPPSQAMPSAGMATPPAGAPAAGPSPFDRSGPGQMAPAGGLGADEPTPAAGVPSTTGGALPTPPPIPKPADAKVPEKKDTGKPAAGKGAGKPAPAAKPTKPEPKPKAAAAAGAAKPGSKTPLIAVAAIVVLLLVAAVIAGIVYMRSGSGQPAEPEITEVIPPPTEQPEVPPLTEEGTVQPEEGAGTTGEGANTTAGGTETTPTGTEQPPQNVAPPEIASFVAEPVTITQGQSAKLRWSTKNTTYVQINPGLARGRGVGEHTVTPAETTKYTLIARGYGGRLTREVTVTVQPRANTGGGEGSGQNPKGWTLDQLTRALESGEDVMKTETLMFRVGQMGVNFPVTPAAQNAILAAGDRGGRPRALVQKIIEIARRQAQ